MASNSTAEDKPSTELYKVKTDWYQTEESVVLTLLAKNAENVKVDYDEKTLSVSAKLLSGNDYKLNLHLAHQVIPTLCFHKVTSSKIEVKLKKKIGIRWSVLECITNETDGLTTSKELLKNESQLPKYPSSSKKSTDWDKIEKEIEKEENNEKPEGEAGLNFFLQKIYGSGTDEVKRAMNKSFQESGGTVLSTNWSEVRKETVERKPPDGMEWKSWV